MDYSATLARDAPKRTDAARRAQPLDASMLDPATLDDWLETFRWPVSDGAFDGFARAVLERFAASVAAADSEGVILLTSDYGFVGFLLQHLHLKAAAERFHAAGTEPAAGPVTRPHLDPDWDALAAAFDRAPDVRTRLRLRLRGLAKSWLVNRHLALGGRLRALLPGCPTRVLGSFTPLMTECAETGARPARHVYAEAVLPAAAPPRAIGDALADTVRALLGDIDGAARAHLATTLDIEAALACWSRRLAALSALAHAVRAADAAPRRLLLANSGNVHHRLLAQVWRAQGAEVIGFHHGNQMGVQPNDLAAVVELALYDRFVVPTAKCAEWLRPAEGGPRFVSAETDRYRALHRALAGTPPAAIRRVMIVAFPLSWIRYPGYTAHYALLQLDVEMRLARTLRASGYEVAVKVHPEWQTLAERLWRGRVDALPAAPFEQCWREADAFVFPRVSSTAFGHALCTDRPVIVLDPAEQRWNAEAKVLLRRRCRFVPSHLDAANRLRFDGDALRAALGVPPSDIDCGFVETAMYPAYRVVGA